MNQNSPESHTFFVTSRGYAADHWYSWFVKALNAHPEILAYLANEGSRPKYFSERTRAERPDLVSYTRFLADVGITYTAIGDCYSYRANKLTTLFSEFGNSVPIINLLRHPYAWLKFYVDWRINNMRMPDGHDGPILHEWNIAQHDLFADMNLHPYTQSEVEIWATYQGMLHLNNIIEDIATPVLHYRLEELISNPEIFNTCIQHLTHGRVTYSPDLLAIIYTWVWKPFRGENQLRVVPEEEYATWPEWKLTAFQKIHSSKAKESYESFGYQY